MEFKQFRNAVSQQFLSMQVNGLFRALVDKDAIWDLYLASFPEGSNPVYKERTEHDCQCCKSFIRHAGSMVSIVNGKLVSIWDIEIGGPYQAVADALSAYVKSVGIDNVFLQTERTAGVDKSYVSPEVTWEHLFVQIPNACVCKGVDIGPKLSDFKATHDVMFRGLNELSLTDVDLVLELIGQNSLYRGEEHTFALTEFRKLKVQFDKLTNPDQKDLFVWSRFKDLPQSVSRFRNTVIGTLLVDLASGVDLENAVASFETKVAPTNYKRPTALVTKAMVEKAKETIDELGLAPALERRYAVLEDITVNNILFANREARKVMNGDVFDDITGGIADKPKKLDEVTEISIENFINDVLPKATSLEVMLENRHAGNLVSLIAPVDPSAKGLFKWPNNFSWSYAGELADSIKERVKRAGGSVTGDLRCSLSWHNFDDLDLHMEEPGGEHIYYGSRHSYNTGGQLDVDMNAGSGRTRQAVENITYPDRGRMKQGSYKLYVNQFCQRESRDVGFEVEIEFDGTIYSFAYDKLVRGNVPVAEIRYSHKDGFEAVGKLNGTTPSKTIWNIPSQTFHKVNVMMLSPNYWDTFQVGNKHYFFMLDGCQNEDKTRGFFNEFLKPELDQHRKVLEIVGSKMKTDESDRQLSGLGFSSTQRNSLLCRVKGSFTRTLKITF